MNTEKVLYFFIKYFSKIRENPKLYSLVNILLSEHLCRPVKARVVSVIS